MLLNNCIIIIIATFNASSCVAMNLLIALTNVDATLRIGLQCVVQNVM